MDGTDHELMNRLRAGERDCLGTLYERHAAGVLRHCMRMVGDSEAARDLTQEVFLRVLRYGASWEGRSRFTTWLYRITHNVCLDHLKLERRRVRTLESVPDESGAGLHTMSDDATARMELSDAVNRLETSLGRLNPAHREIILLIRYQDMSYEEVSRVLDCTVNAARVRFHRAMAALKDEYLKSRRKDQ